LLAAAVVDTLLVLHNLAVAVLVELFKVLSLFLLARIQLLLAQVVWVVWVGLVDLVVETHLL
jgi:hypothetical protein